MNNIEDIIKILGNPKSRKFNDDTKISDFNNYKTTSHGTWPENWKKVYYKAYPRMEQVVLPVPYKPVWSLNEALVNRQSKRNFTKKGIKIEEFSNLLFYSGGLKNLLFKQNNNRRFYPSAGARYPLEIYPFIFNVKNIEPAIYHYHVKSHSLERILKQPFYAKTMKQFNQTWIRKASVLIVVSAIFDRTENKYGDRGLRHIYTEYGHYAQNVSLIATELGLGACSIGGFIDNGLNRLLDFDMVDESVIGVLALGTI